MCGLFVVKGKIADNNNVLNTLHNIKYRGPDNTSIFSDKDVVIGHNRLKILDLSDNSNQPMHSKCGRYVIAYNGEIYNFKDLIKKFNLVVSSNSDTEVLLELYVKHGKEMLNELNGMFAFVIYDLKHKDFFVARDRLGVKPLYTWSDGNSIIFSSEISSIVDYANLSKIDEIGIRQYRKLRSFFNGHTFYEGVKMFPAGSYCINGIYSKYWESIFENREAPKDEELLDLIYDAVKLRLVSDVPIGSFLSGGLDSSIITKISAVDNTWSVGFKEANEFQYAEIMSNNLGSFHKNIPLDYDEFISIAKKMIRARKEPLSVPNEVLIYKMSKQASKFNTVLLSGEGADELFAGYDRIFSSFSKDKFFDIKKFDDMYSYGSIDDLEIIDYVLEPHKNLSSPYLTISSFFQLSHLHGLLRRLDFASMFASVEARTPFLDYRLVEMMSGVPFSYKNANNINKAPLKRIAKGLVDDKIISRKKVGFYVPVSDIFETNTKEIGYDAWLDFNLKEIATIN
jgi:asparagine synthase (glutamine-hydrolysing)